MAELVGQSDLAATASEVLTSGWSVSCDSLTISCKNHVYVIRIALSVTGSPLTMQRSVPGVKDREAAQ
jgi:hypothetical protein